MTLEELGWSAFFARAFEPHNREGTVPARVVARHHGPCELLTEAGRIGGMPAGRLAPGELPAVGDWVAARPLPGERRALIEAVLPRRSAFTRKESWRRAVEQVIAANVDSVLVVTAFGHDLNPRRLERYLAAVAETGAETALVVNKADAAGPGQSLAAVEGVARSVPVLRLSAQTGEGVDALAPYLRPGRTAALVGSSGVGKSTLVNRLCGRGLRLTRPVGASGRGRHVTSNRELIPIPGGGLVLDTPGMRELQLWDAALERAFDDIASLAAGCRFRDCAHAGEPGCAVAAALADGALDPRRLESWRKLSGEQRRTAARRAARARRAGALR